MSAYLKPFLVLLISILIFAGIFFLAHKEVFDFVQTRFYNPSVLNSFVRENSRDAELVQGYIFELQNKFAATLNEPAVQSSFLYNQSQEDIFERSKIFGMLLESTAGLQSVQFVDSNGIRLHYSTSARDIISQNADSTAYRNYTDDPLALPYDGVSVSANGSAKFSMDEQSDRIIFSFPFNDSIDVYRGTALYTVSIRALAEKLIAEGRLNVNENVHVTGTPPGLLLGSPVTSKIDILSKVSSIWSSGIQDRVTFDSGDSGMKFSLISFRTDRGIFFGRLVNDGLFHIPDTMKNILLLSMFLTFFLTLLFIINFKPIPAALVRNRIKRLRESLFEQLYVNKSSQERAKWILELEQRREEIRCELKRDLKLGQRAENNINGIIDKSWDELLAVIKAGSGTQTEANEAETAGELEEVIEEAEALEEIAAVEEIEEIEEAEALEETAEAEDEIEEAEEAKELEEIADIEELEEVIEETEALEEIAGAEDEIEEAEEAKELEEIADIEELEEVEEAEEFIELADAEEIEKVEEAATLEEIAGIEELEEIEEAEALEETTEAEDEIEEAEEAKELEEIADVEELEEVEEAEEFIELADAEEIEKVEEAAALDEAANETNELDKPEAPPPRKGLLSLAASKESFEEKVTEDKHNAHRRGLLALASDLASDIEFNREYPADGNEENDVDLEADLDIVSPFSSMFESLDGGEEN